MYLFLVIVLFCLGSSYNIRIFEIYLVMLFNMFIFLFRRWEGERVVLWFEGFLLEEENKDNLS